MSAIKIIRARFALSLQPLSPAAHKRSCCAVVLISTCVAEVRESVQRVVTHPGAVLLPDKICIWKTRYRMRESALKSCISFDPPIHLALTPTLNP